jgi:flavodoxin
MKILTAYYTRTGNTRKIAEIISETLYSDIDEIIDLKNRKGKLIGFINAGRDAFTKKLTQIKHLKNPEDYNLLIIGTPVWAGTMTPAVRTYLTKNKINKIAFFCTCGSSQGKCFSEMQELTKKPLAVLEVKQKNIFSKETSDKIKSFCNKLK